MIVYSVQKLAAYKLMREQGYLEGNIEFSMFPEEYKWMMEQIEKRLPDYNGQEAPIWVWERQVNRNERSLLPKGTKGVILKLDIPEKDILWSSFEEWHTILNNSPITFDMIEWEEFEKREFPIKDVRETWERLFDMDWLASRPKEWAGNIQEQWLQGATTRITMEQIIKVERFIAK
ncbi:DUF3841 domain-containing protein [Bacillus tuaregi]|uniref:DUF3841 domain-containing protein n=1 Tax=Bacillus tuaregi TaxID=1816695 RepID=UPI0008F7F446|nr:DUF3841 domain-containing protein [Bacillus tuaregi]